MEYSVQQPKKPNDLEHFVTNCFLKVELLASCPTLKLEDHLLSGAFNHLLHPQPEDTLCC